MLFYTSVMRSITLLLPVCIANSLLFCEVARTFLFFQSETTSAGVSVSQPIAADGK